MKTSIEISKLKGQNRKSVIIEISNKFRGAWETLDKNIQRFVFDGDKELNSVTIYSLFDKITKISYGYNI